jgi:hypothetical protein
MTAVSRAEVVRSEPSATPMFRSVASTTSANTTACTTSRRIFGTRLLSRWPTSQSMPSKNTERPTLARKKKNDATRKLC